MRKTVVYGLLIVVLVWALPILSQDPLPEIEVSRITNDLYKFHVNNYVHIFALIGPDGVLLIDSGFEETADQVKSTLKELGNDKVRYIINTHSDGDHTGGNASFANEAVIIAHRVCRKKLEHRDNFPRNGLPMVTFDDSLKLHFDSEEIRLTALPGGHSVEDVIIHFKKTKAVCIGDIIVADSFPFVRVHQDASIEQLLTNLQKIISMFPGDTKILPSHGRQYTIDDLKAYHDMLTKTVEIVTQAMKAGKTVQEMQESRILKDWESWNNKRHTWINADFWIDTIHRNYSK